MTDIHWEQVRQRLHETEAHLHRKVSRDLDDWNDLLQQRARQLSERRVHDYDVTQAYLAFDLASEQFLLAIAELKEIAPFLRCRSLPLTSPELLGVCPHRGAVISVVNLAPILGLATEQTEGGYILFLRTDPPLGIKVDGLGEVHDLSQEEIEKSLYLEAEPETKARRLGSILTVKQLLQHSFLQGKVRFLKE